MYLVFGSLIALICMAGICCIACLLYGKMLCPHTDRGTWAVVWTFGAGEDLEQRVRSLMWLRSCGLLSCAVVVADGGLDKEGRALAVRLARRYPALTLCSRQELEQRIKER